MLIKTHLHLPKGFIITAVLLLLAAGQGKSYASDSLSFINGLKVTLKINHGIVLPHHSSVQYLINKRITGFEILLATQSYGRTVYDKLYRYPRLGIGFLTTSLGNKTLFGSGNAVFGFMDFPFSSRSTKLRLNYQIDFGIGYLSKTYDKESNIMNIAISNNLNAFIGLDLCARYRINNYNEMQAGVKMFHFSNGKISTPNLGINSMVLSAGYIFAIKPMRYETRTINNIDKKKKRFFDVILSAGAKASDQILKKDYFVSSLVVDYKYFPHYKYGFGLGTDFFYDGSIGPNKVNDLGGTYSNSDAYQAGIHAGVYPQYSKITIVVQCGVYLYSSYNKYADFYSRIGFRYKIYKNLLFNMTLKSHYAIADYIEWGIGYSF
jgi:hypothetical protein